MADPTVPSAPPTNLGYGKPSEATIDQVNKWMRSTPWYNDLLKSWGQDPRNVHLNDAQKKQIVRAAQAQGVVVDEGKMEVDPSGNFNPVGHKLRNTLIVAGIAGAAIAAPYVLPHLASIGGSGAATLGPSTAANMAATTAAAASAPAGIAGLTAGELGLAGATAGLGATALPGAGTALTGAGGLGGVEAGAVSGLGTTALPGAGTALTGGSSSLNGLSPYIKNLLSQKGSETLGRSLGAGSEAMAQNRGSTAALLLDQNRDLEAQLIAREKEKRDAQTSTYGMMMSGQHAAHFEPRAAPFSQMASANMALSPEAKAAGEQLYQQALKRMNLPDLQNPTGMAPYRNLANDPSFQGALKPGLLERGTGIASWALPLASQILGWGK